MLNNQIYNQLYSIERIKKDFSLNIEYDFTHSLFDRVIESVSWINIFDKQTLGLCKLPTNACIVSNPIEFSQRKTEFQDTIKKYLILFHDRNYGFIKKEDLSIIDSTLKQHKKICFSEKIMGWGVDSMSYINYGVPNIDTKNANKKPVLVLNLNNNTQTNTVYNILKNRFSDIDILNKNNYSLNELYEKISEYKICIDFDMVFNLLISSACGCYGIGVGQTDHNHIFSIKESNEIPLIVKNILENYTEDKSEKIKENILKLYDFEKFNNAFKEQIINISLESIQ